MQLILGGAFQGKKEYVTEHLGISKEQIVDGKTASYEAIFTCVCMDHFHAWVRARLLEGKNLDGLEEELMEKNPELLLITNELGYGVVPVEAFDRMYRETTGRVCTRLAAKSSCVVRVVCGIGTVLKDG